MSVLDAFYISLVWLEHHRHGDDAVEIRFLSAFLANVVASRRDVLFDRNQLLWGSEVRIDVEFAVEDFSS